MYVAVRYNSVWIRSNLTKINLQENAPKKECNIPEMNIVHLWFVIQ